MLAGLSVASDASYEEMWLLLQLVRKCAFLFVGGLTSDAIWPEVESTNLFDPPSSWVLR